MTAQRADFGWQKGHFIWMDGQFIAWDDAQMHPMSNTVHYGVGIFDGIRMYDTAQGPAIFRMMDHNKRFFESAKIINMNLPLTLEELNKAMIETAVKNNIASAYIRPMAYYGAEFLGLHNEYLQCHVIIALMSIGQSSPAVIGDQGLKLMTSSYTRNHVNSMLLKAKINGAYVNSMLAYQEAHSRGFSDAVMLDTRGLVAEATTSNLFVVRNNVIFTPKTSTIFPGLTRDTIKTIAKDLGYEFIECDMTRDELYIADELFLTGTARELLAVTELDGRCIGSGGLGPITSQLTDTYKRIVSGQQTEYSHWLNWVNKKS